MTCTRHGHHYKENARLCDCGEVYRRRPADETAPQATTLQAEVTAWKKARNTMPKYHVKDRNGEILAEVIANTEEEALTQARLQRLTTAAKAEEVQPEREIEPHLH